MIVTEFGSDLKDLKKYKVSQFKYNAIVALHGQGPPVLKRTHSEQRAITPLIIPERPTVRLWKHLRDWYSKNCGGMANNVSARLFGRFRI